MRFDDDRTSGLSAAERREFEQLARRLTDDTASPRWDPATTGWAWAVVAVAALAGLVPLLGMTPVVVPFAAFVFALVAANLALGNGRDRRIAARLARALGLAGRP